MLLLILGGGRLNVVDGDVGRMKVSVNGLTNIVKQNIYEKHIS